MERASSSGPNPLPVITVSFDKDGARLSEIADKYALANLPRIDCESRLHLCKARCCHMKFSLSRQDVEEGLVRWDEKEPFRIARQIDGACHHLNEGRCSIYIQRPGVCRVYDCRVDKRIWIDFEARIPAV